MIELIKNAYVNTYGLEKWESLTPDEKRNAVMFVAKNMCDFLGYDEIGSQIEVTI